MEQKELNAVLEAHLKWLRYEDGGIRADLSGAHLRYVNLYMADLSGANLYGADIHGANLCEANLCSADLRGTNLYGTNLCGAVLREANLNGAKLYEANLYGADLHGADLSNAYGIPPIACPETGSFIGYKKAYYKDGRTWTMLIITLRVEKDALRSSATTRKCRCSKATILCAESLSGAPMEKHIDITSCHDRAFVYHVGDTIEIPNFDTDRWNECAPGFHFFLTKQEAIDY